MMVEKDYSKRESKRTLDRILPVLQEKFKEDIKQDEQGWQTFQVRLNQHFPKLFNLYLNLYRGQYDFFFHVEDLLISLTRAWFTRSEELRMLDRKREEQPVWYRSNKMMGAVCYVDLFADNINGIRSKIPYFKEIGLTYLHLMPLFDSPKGENDGGYAVSDYHMVSPSLGTMEQLTELAHELRQAGISLAVDLVFNHTSDEHIWAKRARAGDLDYQEYYRIYPDRIIPDEYEMNLREIFPDEHPGVFTYHPELKMWVWTTFHSYQWDLNYANPVVFNRMAEEMLFLANQGVEIFRLDAVAFIWKEVGTSCENLPEAHALIQAFNAVARIAAPALIFKSEAIVHPDDVVKYISPDECQISYNPLLMALLWNSLATREVKLLSQSLEKRFQLHPETAWVNYVRVHDDIGWTFSDEDASLLGINGNDHRQFLNEFYRGRFPGSFARGLPFQENPKTGDCRISGTCASLAGLEKAIKEEGPEQVEFAIRRILLLYGVIMTAGGIPLLYLGDEIGTLNDYSYQNDPAHQQDSRWVHRSKSNWERYEKRNTVSAIESHIYHEILKLIELRKEHDVFSGGQLEVIHTKNDHVLGYVRKNEKNSAVIFVNFSETLQTIRSETIQMYASHMKTQLHGISKFNEENDLIMESLDFVVFT